MIVISISITMSITIAIYF